MARAVFISRARVLVLPKATNPYQELLYSQLVCNHHVDVSYLYGGRFSFLACYPKLLEYKLTGGKLIHLHWLYFLDVPIPGKLGRWLSYINSRLFLSTLQSMNFKVVWTVHNVIPHDADRRRSLILTRKLAAVSAKKIIHSSYTLREMEQLALDTSNASVIPHGSYVGVYPEAVSRAVARKHLKIRKNEIVILFFGLVRPYKGVDDLVESFQKLAIPNVRLVIAGKCTDANLKAQIARAQESSPIDFYEGHVADEDVQTFFKACDVVCVPFKAVTTSGSALLALSFGRPIVAPLSGSLLDLPREVGYLYDPGSSSALEQCLATAIRNKEELKVLGLNARKYVKRFSWDKISDMTYGVYVDLLG
jgi:beta-1,4-mannosyltransferase